MRGLSASAVFAAPGERTDCPACASPRVFHADLLEQRGGALAFVTVCHDCGIAFVNPQPSPAELAHFYSPAGTWVPPQVDSTPGDSADGYGRAWARRFDPIRDELVVERPPAGARVLDFGCGDGSLLDRLQACGWETWGIEPATDIAFHRHRRLEDVPADATFDLVVLHHVLEHVPDPVDLLRRLARASRPGAFLSVAVPRLDTLPLHRDYKYVLNGRAHIVAYTWPCLRGLLLRSGWAPVADPPDEVSKGGGRRTRARLQVLARLTTPSELPEPAGAHAHSAIREFYRRDDARPLLVRLGWLRLAARMIHARRRREVAARKAARRRREAGA